MIRTTFAIAFVLAFATCAHANVPKTTKTSARALVTVRCTDIEDQSARCAVQLVTRGQADLAPRHIAPAASEARKLG